MQAIFDVTSYKVCSNKLNRNTRQKAIQKRWENMLLQPFKLKTVKKHSFLPTIIFNIAYVVNAHIILSHMLRAEKLSKAVNRNE